MIRIIIGCFMTLIFGLVLIAQVLMTIDTVNQQNFSADSLVAIFIAFVLTIIGVSMVIKGRNKRKRIRKIKELALKKQSESGAVNVYEVSKHTGISVIEVSKVVNKLGRKGLIAIATGNGVGAESNQAKKTNDKKKPLLKCFMDDLRDCGLTTSVSENDVGVEPDQAKKNNDKKKHLKYLLDEDLITREEYEAKCRELGQGSEGAVKPKQPLAQKIPVRTTKQNVILVDGKMKVNQLIKLFSDKANLGVRIYSGRQFAKGESLLNEIGCSQTEPVEVSVSRRRKVGNFEKYFKQLTGINIQVEGKSGNLADNNLSIAKVS